MKRYRGKQIILSNFICPECNKQVYKLPRNNNKREKGHIKDLYCPWCKQVTKCLEIRNKDSYIALNKEIIYE